MMSSWLSLTLINLCPFRPSVGWPLSLLLEINVFHELDKMAVRALDSHLSLAAPVEILLPSFSICLSLSGKFPSGPCVGHRLVSDGPSH